MRVLHFLRRTEDWPQVKFQQIDQHNVFRLWVEGNRHWWELGCGMSWFTFRERIKWIALDSWKIPFVFTDHEAVLRVIRDDDILIPTDDDDWYSPDLEGFLRENVGDAEFGYWNPIVFQTAFDTNFHEWKRCHHEVCSCAYFVRGSLLRRLDYGNRREILLGHVKAPGIAVANGAAPVEWPKAHLSVYNWHLGSISAIHSCQTLERLDTIFPTKPIPPLHGAVEWCRPQYEAFKELYESLTFKRGLPRLKVL